MKQVDHNQFWLIKDNPITKAGVFPYLGKQISPELEPDKIYQVYRPAEEIRKAADTFKLVPLVDNHTMIGKDFTPAEEKGVHGVLGEEIKEKDGVLYADVKIFSESLKNLIQNGKKELSLGYFCEYDLTPGEYHGVHYDAVQRGLRGNHIALVDNGRMGHDVRVMDSMAFDAMDIFTAKEEDWISVKSNGDNLKEGLLKEKRACKTFIDDSDFDESKVKRDELGRFAEKNGSKGNTGVEGNNKPVSVPINKEKALKEIQADNNFKTMESKLANQKKVISEFNNTAYTPLEFYDFFNYHKKDLGDLVENEADSILSSQIREREYIIGGDDLEAKRDLIENEWGRDLEDIVSEYNEENDTDFSEEDFLNSKDVLMEYFNDYIYDRSNYEDIKDDLREKIDDDVYKSVNVVREQIIMPIEDYIKTLLPRYGYQYKDTDKSYTESTYIKFETPEELLIVDDKGNEVDERDTYDIRLSLHGDRHDDVGRMSINLRDTPEKIAEKINIFLSRPNKDYRKEDIYFGVYDNICGIFTNDRKDLSSENYGVGGKDAAPKKENEMDKREAIREIMAISAKPVSEFAGGEEEKVETIAKLAEKLAYKPSETSKADDACGKDADVDKRKLIDEIGGILKDKVSEEIIRTVMGKAEELAYNKSEAGTADDEDPDKDGVKEADEALTEKINGVENAVDAMPAKILRMLADREALYKQVSALVGTFDHAAMTEKDMAVYACDKLDDLKGTPAHKAVDVLKGYLKAQKPARVLSMDAAPLEDEKDAGFEAFMKGEK